MSFNEQAYADFVRRRLFEIEQRIATAKERAGDPGRSVQLIAVTKYVGVQEVAVLSAVGIASFGENRLQVARPKLEAFPEAQWHFIGPLQRNKAAHAARQFAVIQSVDRASLAEDLSEAGERAGKRVNVLLQVNISREEQKSGVLPENLVILTSACARLPGLSVRGLMAIGRKVEAPEDARADFAALRELRNRTERDTGVRLPELSMGMSENFDVAVEEGATMVRVGRFLVTQENSRIFPDNRVS